jgi:hypothetical protein
MPPPVGELIPFGLLVELVLDAAHALGAMAGFGAFCFRTWAVLAGKPADTLRRWTSIGAVAGAGFMIVVVLVDLIVEGG